MDAFLLLEDGTVFKGSSFGALGEKCGEVVFNTSLSGYQEILTDPSYNEQIVTMTYPQIGNYGINKEDMESRGLFLSGFIAKECCEYPSNWRSEMTLSEFLKKNKVIGLQGIDTRKLVKHIREKGAMRGIISSNGKTLEQLKKILSEYKGLVGKDIVKDVTVDKKYTWTEFESDVFTGKPLKAKATFKVVAIDYGVKYNILRMLKSRGCSITVVPASTSAKDILRMKPDGIFLSNGPGDPSAVTYAIETIKALIASKTPMFGICLGHQLISLALGGDTYKLKFGHRGGNHPVKNLKTGKVEITSQNHGFCVDIDSFKNKTIEITHMNLNDNTVEGIKYKKAPVYSVQYHPEASPGPKEASYLFDDFIKSMETKKN